MEPQSSLPCSHKSATGSYPEPAESSSPHRSLRSTLMLPSHIRLHLPSGLLHSGLPNQNPVNTSPLPHACHMSRPPHSPWFNHPNNIRWIIQAVKFIIMQLSPRSNSSVTHKINRILNEQWSLLTYLLTYLLTLLYFTYLLTHSIVQDIHWRADSISAYQIIAFLYGTRRFITVLTKACHQTLSSASRTQFASSINKETAKWKQTAIQLDT
jgi:hypothetical protein